MITKPKGHVFCCDFCNIPITGQAKHLYYVGQHFIPSLHFIVMIKPVQCQAMCVISTSQGTTSLCVGLPCPSPACKTARNLLCQSDCKNSVRISCPVCHQTQTHHARHHILLVGYCFDVLLWRLWPTSLQSCFQIHHYPWGPFNVQIKCSWRSCQRYSVVIQLSDHLTQPR